MGQGNSFPDTEKAISVAHGKLKSHLSVLSKIAKVTYPEFLQSVEELNQLWVNNLFERYKKVWND